ncbi:hypothetical protein GB993_00770 [Lactobacillus rossiae]|uniref:Uncharacterized protein n=1 Tax=Furfurilactobacillus milii TaxID=2888272 RepID=A0A6N9HYX8_9LACO|nr:hypothetical protein [Furfurilactobacillus milii]
MSSRLTSYLATKYFNCGIERLCYYRDLGPRTTLYIEGVIISHSYYEYQFYKATFLPHHTTKYVVYAEHLTMSQLVNRVGHYCDYLDAFSFPRHH